MASKSDRRSWRLGWIWLILLFLELSFVIVFVTPESIAGTIKSEKATCAAHLGLDACLEIKDSAEGWYRTVAIDSGIRQATYNYLIERFDRTYNTVEKLDDRGFGLWSERLLQTCWGSLYLILWRAATVAAWVPWFLALAIATIVDASVRWRIQQWRFTYRSPAIHYISIYGIQAIFFGVLFIFIMPFSISPLWTPVGILTVLVFSWLLVSNMMKRV